MSDAPVLNPEADDQKVLAQVVSYYHKTLKESPLALDFLRRKGLNNSEFIDHFRVGFANRTLGLSLPPKIIKAGRAIRTKLQKVGLYRSSGHEHFNGCVTFPVTASDGSQRILDVYGRKIGGKRLRKGTPMHMHLADERHGVWNVESFGAGDEVILCTSLLDALTFWCHGYRNVTCSFGPDGLLEDHLDAFREYHIRRVMTTNEGFSDRITEAGVDCFLLRFPKGMSVNEYAAQVEEPAQKLGNIIRKAEWLAKGKREGGTPTASPAISKQHADEVEHVTTVEPNEDETNPTKELDDDDGEAIHATSRVPPSPQEPEAEVSGDEVTMSIGHRRYRVRGLAKNTAFEVMKVNVLVSTDRGMFVDTFDLYSARHRKTYVTQAAIELGVEEKTIKKDLGRVLLKLEELQDEQISALLEPKGNKPTMTAEEKDQALQFLRDPKLLDRIVSDFAVVGEETNKVVGYLAAVSRKLNDPLAVIIQSSSAAGKTSLMEAILSFIPPEDEVKFSAMTGQSLFYMGECDLKHKVLAIVEEEGADKASYALKLLQSEGELMIASTGKEASTGRLITQTYRVEGPVMIFLTTTAITIDEELMNRCVVLSVDEDREQTRAIHRLQRHRQTLDGLLAVQTHQHAIKLHRNAQRLLRPLLVANPYAEQLTFNDYKTRTRRDHMKYLTLIRSITLLHQYQRPVKTANHNGEPVEYIEVTLEDIKLANRLASEVLGRTTDDLPPQTQRLLHLLDEMVTEHCNRLGVDRTDYRFTRRDVRESTGWGNTQLKVHLKRLEELEYLIIHRGGRGQSFVYELLDGLPKEPGQKFLSGLIDLDKLRGNRSDSEAEKSVPDRPQVGTESPLCRPTEIAPSPVDETISEVVGE